jgi:putative ABC transport system substrate-binding protein
MERRAFLGVIAGGLLAAPLAVEAQQAGKTARVGLLRFGPPTSQPPITQSPLEAELRNTGWVEGKNLVMERRSGQSADELHSAAAELVRLKVDVLIVPSCGLAQISHRETKVIPVVIQACGLDLVETGLVASLARPGVALPSTSTRFSRGRAPRISLLSSRRNSSW